MKKLNLLCLVFLLVLSMVDNGRAQVARPTYNTGNGFFVLEGKLYDASGNEFIPMGANTAVYWQSEANALKSFADMKKAGANCARIICVTPSPENLWAWNSSFTKQKACVKTCVDNKIIPILEFHDATCGNDYDNDAEGKNLKKCVDYWCTSNLVTLCKDYERYLIVNVANEWGPTTFAWRDDYKKAITAIRTAGIKNTLLIDAGGCGQNPATIVNYGKELLDFDPEHNILFSIHFYGNWMTKEKAKLSWQFYVEDYLPIFKTKKLPIIVGEFGWTGAPNNFTPYDSKTIISECNRQGIGWLYWAWNSASTEPFYNIVTDYTKGYSTEADLTVQGKYMVQQFKDLAKESKTFLPTSAMLPESELKQPILVYPNPLTSKTLNIDYRNLGKEDFVQIQLKNLFGQTVRNIQVDDHRPCQLMLDGITPGTYFLCFVGDAKSFASKLVITQM